MNIEVFAMDSEKEEFVVFKAGREDDANAYIWVRFNDEEFIPKRDIKVTSFYGVANYCIQSGDSLYVGNDMPEDKIKIAEERLAECPKERMKAMLDEFNNGMAKMAKDEAKLEEYVRWEDAALEDAKNSEDGQAYF